MKVKFLTKIIHICKNFHAFVWLNKLIYQIKWQWGIILRGQNRVDSRKKSIAATHLLKFWFLIDEPLFLWTKNSSFSSQGTRNSTMSLEMWLRIKYSDAWVYVCVYAGLRKWKRSYLENKSINRVEIWYRCMGEGQNFEQ